VAVVLALGCAAARSDDGRKPPPSDPDPGFLEFLGSVDRLADVNPDYLSQTDPANAATPAGKVAVPSPAPPPAPPPRQLPPQANASRGPINE
jgi:hypothetical protein